MTKLKAMALNRMFSKVHLDSLTELKQMCESVRLLFSSQIIGSKLNLVSIIGIAYNEIQRIENIINTTKWSKIIKYKK